MTDDASDENRLADGNGLTEDDQPSAPEAKPEAGDIAQLLPEATSGRGSVEEALAESLRQPVKLAFFTPSEQRFPPLGPVGQAEGRIPETALAEPMPRKRKRLHGNWRHDLVALLFFLLTIALCGYLVAFWQDPYAAWNPLAKPTPFAFVTWTPDLREVVNLSATQTAAAWPTPMPSTESTGPAEETSPAEPLMTAASVMQPFALDEAGVIYAPNANARGCEWASIAGTVSGRQGEPLDNYAVKIVDAADPERLDVQVFSGAALTFGEGGFEFYLGGTPREGRYIVQLLSPEGIPVSDEYLIFTRDTCAQNVVIVNFVQVGEF